MKMILKLQYMWGEELSYEDERIIKGTVAEIKDKNFNNLSVVVIENMSSNIN